jgi:outer membrane receptor for ferrienterochelin and colicin
MKKKITINKLNYNRITYLLYILLSFLSAFNLSAQDAGSKSNDSLDIWSLSLDEVLNLKVVAAQKTERNVKQVPASVIVITRNEIAQNGYKDLQEILNQVPGLYLWNDYHVRGRINIGIRGYNSCDDVIILVNGVNQVEGMYNEYLLTKVAVPVDAIDRIEVVRGPMSVMYGSGAFFGVINIITNDIPTDNRQNYSVTYGSDNFRQGTLKSNITSNDLKVGFTASAYKTDGMDQPYSEMMSNPDLLTNWGLTTDATTKGILKDKSAYFNLTTKCKGFIADMTHTESERGGFLVQPPVSYSPTKRHSTNFMTSYEHAFTDHLKVLGKFSYLTTNALAFYFLNEKDSYLSFGYNSDTYEAEAIAFIKIIPKLNLTVGLAHRNVYYATNPAELTGAWGVPYGLHLTRLKINSHMIENAVYAQLDYTLGQKLELIGGLRFQQMLPFDYQASGGAPYISQGRQSFTDTYGERKVYAIPSLAGIFSFNDKHHLKLLFGEALRNPPLGIITDILFSTGDDDSYDFPQLVPSRIRTYELNYSGIVNSNLSLHFSFFRNELNNLISQYFLNVTDTTTVYYSSNKGKIFTHGMEASVSFYPVKNLNFSISGTYQHSTDQTSNIEHITVPYSPEVLGYARIVYSYNPHWTVHLSGRYVDAMETDYDIQKKSRLGKATPSFTELNGGIIIKNYLVKGLQFNFDVNNITNAKMYYPVTTLDQFADKGFLGFPRRFFIGAKYEF